MSSPTLQFEIAAQYREVIAARNAVKALEDQIKNLGPGASLRQIASLESQLRSAKANLNNLTKAAQDAGASLELNLQQKANQAIGKIEELRGALSNPIQGAIQIAGLAALGKFLSDITRVRSEFQQMEASINTLLGSERKGKQLMDQLNEFAKTSPLDFKGVVSKAQMMLGFGIEQEKILPFMKALSDVSMGNAQRFQGLALAFSQMSAAGKLMGQDLNQMVNWGFQPLDQMAKDTGKSIGQLKKEMSAGKISAEMVQQAFINATSEGGKYFGMSEAANKSISGQMEKLGDAMTLMYNDIGKASEKYLLKAIEGASNLIEKYDEIGPVLGKAIATFGVFKASMMASEYITKTAAQERSKAIIEGFEEEMAKMKEYKEAAEVDSYDKDISDAVKSNQITKEQGKQYQDQRNELQGEIDKRLEAAQAAEDQAKSVKDAAQATLDDAEARVKDAENKVKAANLTGNAADQAAAQAELKAAQTDRDTASSARNTAASDHQAAATGRARIQQESATVAAMRNSNAQKANAAAQNMNTAATNRGAIAQSLYAMKSGIAATASHLWRAGVDSVTNGLKALKVAWMTNPLGLIATAVMAAWTAISYFSNKEEETSEAAERFGESAAKTQSNVETLYAVLNTAAPGSKMYKDAMKELCEIHKENGIELDAETASLQQVNEKRKELIDLIQKEGRVRVLAADIERMSKERLAKEDELIGNFKKQINGVDDKDRQQTIAEFMNNSVQGNIEELTRLLNQRNSSNADSIDQQIADIIKKDAKEYAEAVGEKDFSLDDDDVADYAREYIKWYGAMGKQLDATQKLAEKANKELAAAKEEKVKDISTLSADKLLNEFDKVINKQHEINETTVKPGANQIDIDKLAGGISKVGKQIAETSEQRLTVTTDLTGVISLNEEIGNAYEGVFNLDSSSASPTTDNGDIKATKTATELAIDELLSLDGLQICPTVNQSQIEGLLSTLAQIQFVANSINGTPLFGTKEEAELFNYINSQKKFDPKTGNTTLPQNLLNNLEELTSKMEQRAMFMVGEGPAKKYVKLKDRSQIVVNAVLTEKYKDFAGGVSGAYRNGQMKDSDRASYEKLMYTAENQIYREDKSQNKSERKRFEGEIIKRVKAAKSKNDRDNLKSELSKRQAGVDEEKDKDLWLFYERQINILSRSGLEKRIEEAKKDANRVYERSMAKVKDNRRTDQMTEETGFQREEEGNKNLGDGIARKRADAKLNLKKANSKVYHAVQAEMDKLEQEAVKDHISKNKDEKGNPVTERHFYLTKGLLDSEGEVDKKKLIAYRAEHFMKKAEENIGASVDYDANQAEYDRTMKKLHDEELKAYVDFLNKYGQIQDKIIAAEKDYQLKREKALKDGDGIALASATAERDNTIRSLKSEQVMKDLHFDEIFGSVQDYTKEMLRGLDQKLEGMLNNKDLSVEDKNKIITKRGEIANALYTKEHKPGFFNMDYVQYYRQRGELKNNVAVAQRSVNEARAEVATKRRDAQNAEVGFFTKATEGMSDDKAKKFRKEFEDAEKNGTTNELFDKFGPGKKEKVIKAYTSYKTAQSDVKDAENKETEQQSLLGKAKGALEGLSGSPAEMIAKGINQNIQSTVDFAKSMGADKRTMAHIEQAAAVSGNLMGSFDALKNGDIMGCLAKLTDAVNGVLDWFSLDEIMDVEQSMEDLADSNRELSYAMNLLREEMHESSLAKALESYNQQTKNLDNQQDRTKKVLDDAGSVSKFSKHSAVYYMNKAINSSEWETVSKLVGRQVRGAGDFLKLTPEQVQLVRKDLPDLYSRMKKAGKDGLEDISDMLDEYSEIGKQRLELEKEWNEMLTQTTFDSTFDEFKSMLMDMSVSAERFSDSFEEMMKNAVMNSLISNLFHDRIKEWYDEFSKAMSDQSISQAEREQLKEKYQAMAEEGIKARNEMYDMMGWKDSTAQSSTTRSIGQISQDTGDAIEGRLTSLQMIVEGIRAINTARGDTLASISGQLLTLGETCKGFGQHHETMERITQQVQRDLGDIRLDVSRIVQLNATMKESLEKIERHTSKI